MKTEISRFCAQCAESIAALPARLVLTAEQFERRSDVMTDSLVALNEIRAHLRSLTDKLRAQRAYLLIFGPLKSGKSTLMNAISGAYVSEVTSLPGYPCLVFARHGKQPRFAATRYNGRESEYADATVLKEVIAEAHLSLAQQIRQTEAAGAAFDPRLNYPEAIRRVDIEVNVPALEESATVLVDTPGLYSRMNFGYDVLTREFRDSASCAVFVVKPDNLFLEQVFAEFNQLLGIFSRIFIVVNVDAGKRDLAPDGSLRPSAESSAPAKIIEAFTTFSMAGPMREAYDAGRVRIHAVDLLGAAAGLLSGDGAGPQREAFDAFLRDLTDYVNSNDYTREFVRDSLRQARNLCVEARLVARSEEVDTLRAEQAERRENMERLDAKIAAADRLLGANWPGLFQKFRDDMARRTEASVRSNAGIMREEMRTAAAKWFSNDESLSALTERHWNESLLNTARSIFDDTIVSLHDLATAGSAGVELSPDLIRDVQAAGFALAPSAEAVLPLLAPHFDSKPYPAHLGTDALPLRKTFVDWLFLRSTTKVRRLVFGDGTRDIPVKEKSARLHEPARAAMDKALDATVAGRFPALPEKYSAELAGDYAARCSSEIVRRLRTLREELGRQRASLQEPFDENASLLEAAEVLEKAADNMTGNVDLLFLQEGVEIPGAAKPVEAAPAEIASATDDLLPQLPPLLIG